MRNNAAINKNPKPGIKSPLFLASMILGAYLLFSEEYDRAVYVLAVAGTVLLTNNKKAQAASAVGGVLRTIDSGALGSLGFFAQSCGVLYAVAESFKATKNLEDAIKEEERKFPGQAFTLGSVNS